MRKPRVPGYVDGNAFSVIGAVSAALRKAGKSNLIEEYKKEATSSDYNHLLDVSERYVDFDIPLDYLRTTTLDSEDGLDLQDSDEDSED